MKKSLLVSLVIVFCSMFISACAPKTKDELRREVEFNVVYVQDPRTGICFARSSGYGGHKTYSYVPCELIKDKSLINFSEHFE